MLLPRIHLDLRSLALFRILLGVYLLYDIYSRLALGRYDLAWYTSTPEDSFLIGTDTPHTAPLHQFWFHRGTAATQLTLFVMTVLLVLCFILGVSFTKPLLWLAVTSYQNRNMFVHDGSDTYVRHLLLWSCFLPLEEKWSVLSTRGAAVTKIDCSNLAVQGLVVQMVAMYEATVLHRTLDIVLNKTVALASIEWLPPTLSAVHYAIAGSFATRHHWLTHHIVASAWLSLGMTASAMVVECVVPLLLLSSMKQKSACAVQLFLVHAGLLVMLRLPNWQWLGMLTQVVWIPSSFWNRTLKHKNTDNVYKKTDGDTDKEIGKNTTQPLRKHSLKSRISYALQVFFFTYMIYNWCGERGWIPKHDNGDIGEALRLSQYWVMYGQVEHTAHTARLTGILSEDHRRVDLFQYIATQRVVDQDDTSVLYDMSRRYPSARWERALHGWTSQRDKTRVQQFGKALCYHLRSSSDISVETIEWSRQHYTIGPPGCGTNSRYTKEQEDSVIRVECR